MMECDLCGLDTATLDDEVTLTTPDMTEGTCARLYVCPSCWPEHPGNYTPNTYWKEWLKERLGPAANSRLTEFTE